MKRENWKSQFSHESIFSHSLSLDNKLIQKWIDE